MQFQKLGERADSWDIVVVGGGATGVGIALDAATRGYSVALFEQHDFGKGTSSRSTKLIHGGVRYLQQGNVGLVCESLRERGRLRTNAPHLVYPLPTIVPLYHWWEGPYYRLGLKAYDLLAGRYNIGKSSRLSWDETIGELPTIRRHSLRGGIRYYDAGFDDARLLVALAQTAVQGGAVCLNYAPVERFLHLDGKVAGVVVADRESGEIWEVPARVVINAAGPFSDQVRQLEDPQAEPQLALSQGIHLVVGGQFLPGESALIVPKTSDGRVVFAIPWHGHALIGTTDTPLQHANLEPRPQEEEIAFLLRTIGDYLETPPTRADVLSVFVGIRPLQAKSGAGKTSKLGRDHMIHITESKLISIIGGKWTTYRKMAEDCVDRAAEAGDLTPQACLTHEQTILGGDAIGPASPLDVYGSIGHQVAELIASDPAYNEPLDPDLPYLSGQVVWAARHEMARTVEDVLSRRLRALHLNAAAALRAAPRVAALLAAELDRDDAWKQSQLEDFARLAQGYFVGL